MLYYPILVALTSPKGLITLRGLRRRSSGGHGKTESKENKNYS